MKLRGRKRREKNMKNKKKLKNKAKSGREGD